MSFDDIRKKLSKKCGLRLQQQKEKWAKGYFQKYATGEDVLAFPHFRMALMNLGIPGHAADDTFKELTGDLNQDVQLSLILERLYGQAAGACVFDVSNTERYIRPSRSSNKAAAETRDVQEEEMRQKKLRQLFDIIGNWGSGKGFKSTRPILRMMDRDQDGFMNLDDARYFFSTYLTTTEAHTDEWFALLDIAQSGLIDLHELGIQIDPYLQKTYANPRDMLKPWSDSGKARDKDEEYELADILGQVACKAQQIGYKNLPELFCKLDLRGKGVLNRSDIRTFFDRCLRIPSHQADRFFDLVDIDDVEEVRVGLVRQVLGHSLDPAFDPEKVVHVGELPHRSHSRRGVNDDFYEEVGAKLHQKGFKNEVAVVAAMSKQMIAQQSDGRNIDLETVRLFFKISLGYPTFDKADKLFALANRKGRKTVAALELKRHVATCFGKELEQRMEASSVATSGPPDNEL